MAKVARYLYAGLAWLFLVGVALQVFLAGMVVVAGQMGWANHTILGHTLILPLLLMLLTMYLGRLPGTLKRMTWLLFVVYLVQSDFIIFLRTAAPVISAFHPVLALVDFALGLALARQALRLAGGIEAPAGAQAGVGGQTAR
jgi:hypothetical protein